MTWASPTKIHQSHSVKTQAYFYTLLFHAFLCPVLKDYTTANSYCDGVPEIRATDIFASKFLENYPYLRCCKIY